MSTRSARALAALALTLAVAACVPITLGKSGRIERGQRSYNRAMGDRAGLGSKPVTGKVEPNRLVARDGTSCIVAREKFAKTILGRSIWCFWTDTDRGPSTQLSR